MQVTITKWGNSQGIRLPKLLLDSVNMSDNDTIEITAVDNSLVLKKIEKNPFITIQERFKDFEEEYDPVDIDWGPPVGNEIW